MPRSIIVGVMQALIEIAGISSPKNSQFLIFSVQTVRNAWSSCRVLYLIGCSLGQQQDLPGARPSGTHSPKDSSSRTAERSCPLSVILPKEAALFGSSAWVDSASNDALAHRAML